MKLLIATLTHYGPETAYGVKNLGHHCFRNGLAPVWHQAITRTNADLLSLVQLGTNLGSILIAIQTVSCKKMHVKCHLQNGDRYVPAAMY